MVFNRTANPVIKGLLRSPFHRLASGNLALITVTGRHSGREYTFPVGYTERDGRVLIGVGWPERKTWWCKPAGARPSSPADARSRANGFRGGQA